MLREHILIRSGLRWEKLFKVLGIPCTQRKTFATRSFSVAGPTYWNALPEDVKKSEDVATFKQILKTHLKIIVNYSLKHS